MHGYNTNAINTKGQISLSGFAKILADAKGLGMGGGPGQITSLQGIVEKPELTEQTWGIVTDVDGNRHAWEEVDLSDPNNIRRLSGGRRGTIDTDSSSEGSSSSDTDGIDDQTAWGLNGESYAAGTIVYVIRINYNAWGIVGGAGDGSSSSDDGSFCFEVDCDAGTINVIDCDSTGTSSQTTTSSNPSSSNPSSSNPSSSDPRPPSSSDVVPV